MSQEPDVYEQLARAVRAADDKGATAPVALEVGDLFPLAEVFLLLSGPVERTVQAISDAVEESLAEVGVKSIRREGRAGGRWILLDLGDLIVHVFHQEERDYYQLERLWKDCPVVDVAPLLNRANPVESRESDGPADLRA